MNPYYPKLFEPLRIRNTVFRNRIFCAPSNHCLQGTETYPTESAIRYYAEKARGGAGTVIAGSCIPDPKRFDPRCSRIPKWNQYNIHDPFNWRYFRQQSDAVHCFGAKACFEFHMPPRCGYTKADMSWTKIYGPSPLVMPDGLVVEEMPEKEMFRIARAYADGAEAVMRCGFDMLLIHGGHGMLIEQFLSPLYNRRTDQYGGSLENRARFPRMIVDAVRERVGDKLILEYRISGTEVTEGGLEIEESKAYIKMIQDKIDIVHVSAGDHSNPHTRAVMHPSGFLSPAPNAYLAKAFKNDPEITIPVAAVGAIYDPETAERLLEEGWCDIVSTARGLIADPFYPEKARHGRADEIVPCIKCFHCLDDHKKNHYFSCSVNPGIGRSGRDHYLTSPPERSKRVAVIGGGPAGMKAALQAAERGHRVTLYEKSESLGGQLRFAADVPFKYDLHKFTRYLVRMLERSSVTVLLGTEATPELVSREGYDAVIAAPGASHAAPAFPVDRDFFYAAQVFGHPEALGERVVIIGGGQVGCETALYLAGCGKDVTLVGRNPALAHDAVDTYRVPLLDRLESACTCISSAACTGVDGQGIHLRKKDGETCLIQTDSVVIATGMRGHLDEAMSFADCAFDFEVVGDCLGPKNVKQAIRTAFDAANRI